MVVFLLLNGFLVKAKATATCVRIVVFLSSSMSMFVFTVVALTQTADNGLIHDFLIVIDQEVGNGIKVFEDDIGVLVNEVLQIIVSILSCEVEGIEIEARVVGKLFCVSIILGPEHTTEFDNFILTAASIVI